MAENKNEAGVITAILPSGFTYRVRLADSREILCGVSRLYFGGRVLKVPKKLRPKVGDQLLVRRPYHARTIAATAATRRSCQQGISTSL